MRDVCPLLPPLQQSEKEMVQVQREQGEMDARKGNGHLEGKRRLQGLAVVEIAEIAYEALRTHERIHSGEYNVSWTQSPERNKRRFTRYVKYLIDNPGATHQALWEQYRGAGEPQFLVNADLASKEQVFMLFSLVGALSHALFARPSNQSVERRSNDYGA